MVFPWPLVASGGPPGPFSGQHLALLSCFSTNKNPVLVAPEALDYSVTTPPSQACSHPQSYNWHMQLPADQTASVE